MITSEGCDDTEDASIERVWAWICNYAASRAGISTNRARAILKDAGFDAYNHTGIVEALEIVLHDSAI